MKPKGHVVICASPSEKVDDPDKGIWHYHHNALGELICQQDTAGQGSRLVYDDLGRLEQRDDLSSVTSLENCTGTVAGSSHWTYGNVSGHKTFGQIIIESTDYAGDETVRDYDYDALGRVSSVTTLITGADGFEREYTESTTYDQHGRVFQAFDASGDHRGVRYLYNAHGYLEALREAREGTQGLVYWQVQQHDERGNVTHALLGNGIVARAQHDPATGRMLNLWTENDPGTISAQDLELVWDELGNLKARHDHSHPTTTLSERFFYDDRNRLEQVDRRSGNGNWQTSQTLGYDLAGNIVAKSGVGSYTYGSNRPHAVTGAGGRAFEYDAVGNVISDSQAGGQSRQYSYTSFNKIKRITSSGQSTEFHYGSGRGRTIKRELNGTTVSTRTHYVGGLEIVWEGVNPPANSGEYRRYIGGVALVTFYQAAEITQVRYQHKDHLGSVTALTDHTGQIVARMAFDPWGQRRDPENLSQPWEQWITPAAPAWANAMLEITPRGYTGHEHLDVHGIVHMNGRIYDPHLGRFLQADPFIEDSTTLNRYTYVHNNPLAYTDPSGFLSKKIAKTVARFSPGIRTTHELNKIVANNPMLDAIGMAAACTWGGPWGCAAASALGTHYRGGSVEDVLKAGAISGATAYAFSQLGQAYHQGGTITRGEYIFYSGVIGGASSMAQGGNFGHGFASAGVTATASPAIRRMPGGAAGRTAAAAIVGGTASSITGGKFANGAVTGAMSYAFGELASRGRRGGGARSGEGSGLRGREAEAFELLQDEAKNVLRDLEARMDAAGTRGDFGGVLELFDAYKALWGGSVTFGRHSDIARATTSLAGRNNNYWVTDVSISFNAGEVMNLYRSGSTAVTSKGYFVDLPSGRQGIRKLLVHEARHGTIYNFMGASGRLTPYQREHDADAFIRRVYP